MDDLFIKDELTPYYTESIVDDFGKRWTDDKIQLVLEMNDYIIKNETSNENISCLELFIRNIDTETQNIIRNHEIHA